MSREDLAAFLRSRRAAVRPEDVGLPGGGRRRAPGLRREEVALLAGVSVTWYTWLEQGRPVNASRAVLDALARALRLTDAERQHLRALADRSPSGPAPAAAGPPPDSLLRMVAALDPNPAYVLGPRWEYLGWNRGQALLYPAASLPEPARNLLSIVFTDPAARALFTDWEEEAHHMLRQFRADTTAIRDDPGVVALVERLREESPEFAGWWAARDVAGFHTRLRRYRHPHAGDLLFEYQQLAPAEWPSLRIVCHLPVPGDDSAARLAAAGAA